MPEAKARAGVRKGSGCEGWCAWRALFGLRTQCRCAPCAHLRWPTPVRQMSDSRVKGWDFQMLGEREYRGQSGKCRPKSILSTPSSRAIWRAYQIFLREHRGQFRKGKPEGRLSALWCPRPVFKRSGRRQASSRNSLPALNAAAVVQVPQAVQRILYKRNVADAGHLPALPSPFCLFSLSFPLPPVILPKKIKKF